MTNWLSGTCSEHDALQAAQLHTPLVWPASSSTSPSFNRAAMRGPTRATSRGQPLSRTISDSVLKYCCFVMLSTTNRRAVSDTGQEGGKVREIEAVEQGAAALQKGHSTPYLRPGSLAAF